MTEEGKRLVWARWQRLTRWEFWPIWAVYPPVILSWLWHAVRLRGLTLWTNCNPAMEASGLALEEKGGILDSFEGPDGRVKIARYHRVTAGADDAWEQVRGFMEREGIDFPIFLKPDFGQRGQGVAIANDEAEARDWMGHCEEGFLVQQKVEGLEFGVHWCQVPGEDAGAISSVCQKLPQSIFGDGERTLKELILADDRAVLMAAYYFRKYREELSRVLADREEFVVAPIGTHSRGAVFTDERRLITDELREVFDELGARYPGFNFGRYDVKVPSVEDFKAGRNIVVLELNGVMGEPAHMYQPGYSWWSGMKDLCGHFKKAAEIGEAWRAQGVKPPEVGDLLEVIRRHCQKEYLEIDDFRSGK